MLAALHWSSCQFLLCVNHNHDSYMTYLAFQSQRIFAGVFISPKRSRTIDREEQSDTGKRLLPSVYIIEKADPISSKTPGPGVLYVVIYFLNIDT